MRRIFLSVLAVSALACILGVVGRVKTWDILFITEYHHITWSVFSQDGFTAEVVEKSAQGWKVSSMGYDYCGNVNLTLSRVRLRWTSR